MARGWSPLGWLAYETQHIEAFCAASGGSGFGTWTDQKKPGVNPARHETGPDNHTIAAYQLSSGAGALARNSILLADV